MLLPKHRRCGDAGVVILPKSTTEMDHFMLEHHLWMVLQGLEPCFYFLTTWTKTSVDGGLVCTEMFVVWLLFTTFCAFSLLDFSCLDVFILKCFCGSMFSHFAWPLIGFSYHGLGITIFFSTFKRSVFNQLKGRPSTLQHLQGYHPWHVTWPMKKNLVGWVI